MLLKIDHKTVTNEQLEALTSVLGAEQVAQLKELKQKELLKDTIKEEARQRRAAKNRNEHIAVERLYLDQPVTDLEIKQHMPLVHRLARWMIGRLPANVELDDLVQVGLIAVSKALPRYDPNNEANASLESYLTYRINGAMLDELRANDWKPRSARSIDRKYEAAASSLMQKLGRKPKMSEIAEAMGITITELNEVVREASCFIINEAEYLSDDDFNESNERFEGYTTLLSECTPERAFTAKQEALNVFKAADRLLTTQEAEIFTLVVEGVSGVEIAKRFNFTESRVSQTMRAVKNKLQPYVSFSIISDEEEVTVDNRSKPSNLKLSKPKKLSKKQEAKERIDQYYAQQEAIVKTELPSVDKLRSQILAELSSIGSSDKIERLVPTERWG